MVIVLASSKKSTHMSTDFARAIKANWSFRWKSFTKFKSTTYDESKLQIVARPKHERRRVSVCVPENKITIKQIKLHFCFSRVGTLNEKPAVKQTVLMVLKHARLWDAGEASAHATSGNKRFYRIDHGVGH